MGRRLLCIGRWTRLGWCGRAEIQKRAASLLELRGLILFCGGVDDDLSEAGWVEAGSADEGSVDVFETAEAGCVVGFDGAAVEDASAGGDGGGESSGDLGADDLVGILSHLGSGGEAGANGPDRLVGDD